MSGFLHRPAAFALALCLSLAEPAFALRGQTTESAPVLAGMEEALHGASSIAAGAEEELFEKALDQGPVLFVNGVAELGGKKVKASELVNLREQWLEWIAEHPRVWVGDLFGSPKSNWSEHAAGRVIIAGLDLKRSLREELEGKTKPSAVLIPSGKGSALLDEIKKTKPTPEDLLFTDPITARRLGKELKPSGMPVLVGMSRPDSQFLYYPNAFGLLASIAKLEKGPLLLEGFSHGQYLDRFLLLVIPAGKPAKPKAAGAEEVEILRDGTSVSQGMVQAVMGGLTRLMGKQPILFGQYVSLQ